MTIELGPGGNTVVDSGLQHVQVALAWKRAAGHVGSIEIDACAFLVNSNGKVRTDRDFIFYNQANSACKAVRLQSGTGDRQVFDIDLEKVPDEIAKIEFALAIHPQPGQVLNFSQLQAAWIDIASRESVLIRYETNPKTHPESALLFGELYRHRGSWKFRALGQGFMGGLEAMVRIFGVNISAAAAPEPAPPEMTLVPKTPASPPPPPSPQAFPSSNRHANRRASLPSSSAPNKKRSKRVPLVLAGAAAVFMLTRCDSDDRVRYVYANQADCIEDWGDDDCYYDDGHYYSYVSTSHPKFKSKSKVGSKALKVVRSGFGRFASSFGSSRS